MLTLISHTDISPLILTLISVHLYPVNTDALILVHLYPASSDISDISVHLYPAKWY